MLLAHHDHTILPLTPMESWALVLFLIAVVVGLIYVDARR